MKEKYINIGNKTYIESDVVMLPAKEYKEGIILKNKDNNRMEVCNKDFPTYVDELTTKLIPQNLYFLSNEEIKREGIWIIENGILYKSSLFDCDEIKPVVIATTDGLTLDINCSSCGNMGCNRCMGKSVPRPSNEFLQKFCKIGGLDKVLIEVEVCDNCIDGIVSNGGDTMPYACPFCNNNPKLGKYGHIIPNSGYNLKIAPDNTVSIKPIEATQKQLWDDAFRVIWNREVSEGTREAMIREKYNITLKSTS